MATSDAEMLNGEEFQGKGKEARKYSREDFEFEKILGEGSYSTVSSGYCGRLVSCEVLTVSLHMSNKAARGSRMLILNRTPLNSCVHVRRRSHWAFALQVVLASDKKTKKQYARE